MHHPSRHWLAVVTAASLVGLLFVPYAAASLSGNLLPNGDFEDFTTKAFTGAESDVVDWSYIKYEHSPRTEAEVSAGTAPVRAWQFHRDYDLGRWIGPWGTTSLDRGITTWDDPRAAYDLGEDVYTQNISMDPLNPGNHMLEGVSFRTAVGVYVAAPEGHVAGEATIDFNYYWNNWTDLPPGDPNSHAASIFHVTIAGVQEVNLPTPSQRWGPNADTAVWGPSGADLLWYSPNWAEWGWTGPGSDQTEIHSLGDQWNHFATDHPGLAVFEITEAYDYYYIEITQIAYAETHPYFWLFEGQPSDRFAMGIDNIVFQVSVEGGVEIPDPVPADFSIDGLVNTEDINPFILALTNTTAWLNYARPVLHDGLTDQQIIDYADPSGDGQINSEDISWFICWLTTPGSCGGGGGGAIIPEPASLGLLGLGALALIRRRR